MYCPQCGVQNQDTARFCSTCGAALAAAESGAPVPAPPRPANSAALVGALVAACVILLMILAVVAVMWVHKAQVSRVEEAKQAETVQAQSSQPSAESEPAPAQPQAVHHPVPVEDPVAEAQVVLERYLAADLGHDGNEMKKYLGGQAAARFVAEVQGQEDVTTHSEKVSGHTVKDDNTIVFSVAVGWSPAGSSEVKTQTDRYVMKRTDAGWRITSTPAYPE